VWENSGKLNEKPFSCVKFAVWFSSDFQFGVFLKLQSDKKSSELNWWCFFTRKYILKLIM
jgi:hypothetical protein